MMYYESLEQMVVDTAEGVRPAERLTVSEAAAKYRWLNNPGAYVGPWTNEKTPYLVEPQDVLSSVSHRAMVFVGPAQCGKTDMLMNWITHTVICDPADMMVIQTSNTVARDFSMRRVDRLHRDTAEVGNRLISRRDADNTFDKKYTSGMLLTLSWPTINELSGKPVPRLWLTDYDRMPEDVDKEGAPFDLAQKRATTFRGNGMCAAESSPGFVVENPRGWVRKTPHEAPPTKGILALYNRGDRRRWYWTCVGCGDSFEPDFSLMNYPESDDVLEAAEAATLQCPHCGMDYSDDPVPGMACKSEMNAKGVWVPDGMSLVNGALVGKAFRSEMASFWLKGPAATFAQWKTLVANYLNAVREYETNQSEEALKTTVNTDQGLPYTPKSVESSRLPEDLKARAKDFGLRVVPPGVRFLIAAIDVQRHRFVVQVHGIGEHRDFWVIDRFDIQKSKRLDEDGERLWVNPGAYGEDWRLIVGEVLKKEYPLSDESGRFMRIKFTVCDSGGSAGVTSNAYDFVRWLRRADLDPADESVALYGLEPGLAERFLLLKGSSRPTAPRVALTFPDSERKDRAAGARGEIPVLMMNTNLLKDTVNSMLDRKEPGGRINFADWLDNNFFTELTVETKTSSGWINPKNFRNESWDLLVYTLAATLTQWVGLDHIRWDDPPGWAETWDQNDLVYLPDGAPPPFTPVRNTRRLKDLGAALG